MLFYDVNPKMWCWIKKGLNSLGTHKNLNHKSIKNGIVLPGLQLILIIRLFYTYFNVLINSVYFIISWFDFGIFGCWIINSTNNSSKCGGLVKVRSGLKKFYRMVCVENEHDHQWTSDQSMNILTWSQNFQTVRGTL